MFVIDDCFPSLSWKKNEKRESRTWFFHDAHMPVMISISKRLTSKSNVACSSITVIHRRINKYILTKEEIITRSTWCFISDIDKLQSNCLLVSMSTELPFDGQKTIITRLCSQIRSVFVVNIGEKVMIEMDRKAKKPFRLGSFLFYFRCAWPQFDFIMMIIIIQYHAQVFSYCINLKTTMIALSFMKQ